MEVQRRIEFNQLLLHALCSGCCAVCYPCFLKPLTKFFFQLGLTLTCIYLLLSLSYFLRSLLILLTSYEGGVLLIWSLIYSSCIAIFTLLIYLISIFAYKRHFDRFQDEINSKLVYHV